MSDKAFLRAMIANPVDALPRLVYSDWLEEQGDQRFELLRTEWNVPRLSFLDWIARNGNLDYYLETTPELRPRLIEHTENERWRTLIGNQHATVDRDWLAVVDTLGRPFHPFFFWNNTGDPSYKPDELPFREQIGTRGTVVTFESSFCGSNRLESGLVDDLKLLTNFEFRCGSYGAASCPIHPFICEVNELNRPMTAAGVLRALRVADFRSAHIDLRSISELPFPGYHPGSDNDEIHTDSDRAHLFPRLEDIQPFANMSLEELEWQDTYVHESLADDATHRALRNAVENNRLWHVLLHGRTGELGGRDRHWWVVLFAVGLSRQGSRLIGAVSHQMCHNFCD